MQDRQTTDPQTEEAAHRYRVDPARDVAYIALFAALIAVLGLVPAIYTVGVGMIPYTIQTMGVMVVGGALGARRGTMCLLVFLALLALGLPLLSGGRGGLGVFLAPTTGYLLAFPLAAGLIGLSVERMWDRLTFVRACVINILWGILLVHLMGVTWLAIYAGIDPTHTDLRDALIAGSLIFIPSDVIKALVAAQIVMALHKYYPLIGRPR